MKSIEDAFKEARIEDVSGHHCEERKHSLVRQQSAPSESQFHNSNRVSAKTDVGKELSNKVNTENNCPNLSTVIQKSAGFQS